MASPLSITLTVYLNESIPDKAGAWEYAGAIGNPAGSDQVVMLIATKRVVANDQFRVSASMLTASVQLGDSPGGLAPGNLTLQGVHDIATGNESGSVSAASPELADYIGGNFTFDAAQLLLTINPPN